MQRAARPKEIQGRHVGKGGRSEKGAVLLEVVLALALFVGAAAVLTSGLSTSLDGVERLRLQTHASNLAVSVLSELQLGIRSWSANGPQPFEAPLEGWTWEIMTNSGQPAADELGSDQLVEVIIRRTDSSLVYRLTEILRLDEKRFETSERSTSIGSF